MNPFLLGLKVRTRPLGLHRISRRDAFVIVAVIVGVGVPLVAAGDALLRRLVGLFPALAGRWGVGPDTLALGVLAAYSLLLGGFMFVGGRLLRRFLSE